MDLPHTRTAPAASVTPLGLSELRDRLQLYNTLIRAKEPFRTRPESPEKVQMYVCGVTVYDFSHIGKVGRRIQCAEELGR